MNRRNVFDLLAGNPDAFSLEHRVFNLFALICIFLALISIPVNRWLGLNLMAQLIPLAFGIAMGYLYILSRKKEKHQQAVISFSVMMFILAPLLWLANGGSMGGSQYYIILIGMLIAIINSGRLRCLLLSLFILMLCTLIGFEYLHPEAIQLYNSRGERFIDVLLSMSMSAITMALLFMVFIDSYRKEHLMVKQYAQHLEKIAITDGQTGLYNHSYIYQKLEEEIARARRYKRKLSIIMLDIDYFKELNDTYGHQYGDYVLSQIADILKKNERNTDTIGRYGGEEFLILCAETGLEEAYSLAHRLCSEIEHSSFLHEVDVTISGGIAELGSETSDLLMEKADRCLYEAKHLGRNRICM